MTPVDQRVLDHDPARGRFGDCLRACVASVLELPYEAVPQFAVADDWVERLQEWLAPRGLFYLQLAVEHPYSPGLLRYLRGHYLVIGEQSRGGTVHCVVGGAGGEQAHDPHPLRRGVLPIEGQLTLGFFVQSDPPIVAPLPQARLDATTGGSLQHALDSVAHRQNRKDGIQQAAMRGDSTFMRERAESVARELRDGELRPESGKAQLLRTRRDIERGWFAIAEVLARDGMQDIADQVRRFVERMPSARTDRELIAERLRAHVRDNHAVYAPPSR